MPGIKDYAAAFSHFDQREKYVEPCDYESEANNLLYKTRVLYQMGNKNEGEACIKKGLEIMLNGNVDKDYDFVCVLLQATLFEQTLKNTEYIKYKTETVIPLLKEKGRYLEAIRYCDILHDYFAARKKYKQADIYASMANNFYKITTKGYEFYD